MKTKKPPTLTWPSEPPSPPWSCVQAQAPSLTHLQAFLQGGQHKTHSVAGHANDYFFLGPFSGFSPLSGQRPSGLQPWPPHPFGHGAPVWLGPPHLHLLFTRNSDSGPTPNGLLPGSLSNHPIRHPAHSSLLPANTRTINPHAFSSLSAGAGTIVKPDNHLNSR